MKDKIAEVIRNYFEETGESTDLGEENCQINLAQAILDLIAKELPKEKEEQQDFGGLWLGGYNQCLKDIKHKLGVS